MNRRRFLTGAATFTVVSAGGATWYAGERGVFSDGEGPAYAPWKDWQAETGGSRLSLVRAALLAASPHNTQPWRFKVSESCVELYLDRQRNVGALDPFLREEQIGMGCALENLMLAAPAHGYRPTAALVPGKLRTAAEGPQSELVARVDLAPCAREETELYRAIPSRHTNRSLYDAQRPIPSQLIRELLLLGGGDEDVRLFLFTDAAQRRELVAISADANNRLYSDPQVEAASASWIRLRADEVQRYRDGLTIDGFGLTPVMSAVAKMLPAPLLDTMVSRGQKEGYAERMFAAPLIGMIAVRDRYDRAQCLQAGRLWQRVHLFATARGVAGRPGNEAMELVDYERKLGQRACLARLSEITGDAAWEPTFVFLLGYPTAGAHPSPRRPVQALIDA